MKALDTIMNSKDDIQVGKYARHNISEREYTIRHYGVAIVMVYKGDNYGRGAGFVVNSLDGILGKSTERAINYIRSTLIAGGFKEN